MSKFYNLHDLPDHQPWNKFDCFGKARGNQEINHLKNYFNEEVLFYLDEKIINFLLDSIGIQDIINSIPINKFNDFSFLTAPAYKALEGFLFQLAKDLGLPCSGNNNLAGSYYFDEEKIDKHIDKILKELEIKSEKEIKLSTHEKRDIKDRIREMKGFLQHYRNTPSHFLGEQMENRELALRNIMIIYGAIDNSAKILLKVGLIKIKGEIH